MPIGTYFEDMYAIQRRSNMEMSQQADRQAMMRKQYGAVGSGLGGMQQQQPMYRYEDQIKINIRQGSMPFRMELQAETDKWLA